MLRLMLALSVASTSAVARSSRRTEAPLVTGWKFQLGDLPFNGGPRLCSDQLEEVAFPISLKGKACALGARDRWSRVTSGGSTNLPADCSRACCTNHNCSLWSWFNQSDPEAPTPPSPPGPPYSYGDCYLGFGPTDPATQCSSKDAQDFVGGARILNPLPSFPPRPPVAAADDAAAAAFDDAEWRDVRLPHDFVIEGEPCFPALGCCPRPPRGG
jgi:hypothetical protein